mgnify:FL=1
MPGRIDAIREELIDAARRVDGDRPARMRAVTDLLWDRLNHGPGDGPERGQDNGPVSWIGFYEIAAEGNQHGAEPGAGMILAAHRDSPACSPIGLHGVCGRSFTEAAPVVVGDVRTLGGGYVACDPRDLSELVVPMFDDEGTPWGVLDADSFEVEAFTTDDAETLRLVAEAAGLSAPVASRRPIVTA